MGRLPGWLSLVSCAVLALTTPARAQLPDPNSPVADPVLEEQEKEQARLLFSEGLQYVENEDWVQAEARFRGVLLLRASHVVAYNLASALSHLGRLMEAAELLRGIVRDASAEPSARSAAEQLLAETEQRIGTLTLRVAGDSAGAVVTLDGSRLELGEILTISVDPGEHRVMVERDSRLVTSETVQIGGAAPLQVSLTLNLPPRIVPVAVARAAQPARQAPPGSAVGARTAPSDSAGDDDDSGDSIFESWWLWTAVGAVAAGGAITGILIARGGDDADPISGDTDPPLLRGTVKAMP
jgi:hypothetical protein